MVDHVGVAGHGEGGGVLARLLHQEGVGEVRRDGEHAVQVLARPLRDVHTSARFKVTVKGSTKLFYNYHNNIWRGECPVRR